MASGSSERPLEILLVEASPADARLAEETLKSSNHPTNITVAEDGEGALARLRKEGEYEGSPRPDLILPGMQGTEVLVEIAADPDLATSPGSEQFPSRLASQVVVASDSRYLLPLLQS